MEKTFTFGKIVMMFFGFTHVVNLRSKEIHSIADKHKNCQIDKMNRKNRKYVTKAKAEFLMKEKGFNGCRWCMKKEDKG